MKRFTMKEVNEGNNGFNGDDFYIHLANIIGDQAIIKNVDMRFLSKYLTDNTREIEINELPNGRMSIYVTNGKDSSESCLIEAGYSYLRISEIKYRRVGNGTNQEGTLFVSIFRSKENELVRDGYAVEISDINEHEAKLTYFGDTNDRKTRFVINVDPKTLDGFGEEKKITNTLNHNNVLNLFRVPYLKGNNKINGYTMYLGSSVLDKIKIK